MPEREPHPTEEPETYRMLKDAPLLKRGICELYPDSGLVYKPDSRYPLRSGLAGFLWLLRTEPGWFRRVAQSAP